MNNFAPRVIYETGIEGKIASLVEPALAAMGYMLVRIRMMTASGCTLQIMVDVPNRGFNVSDCEIISKELSPLLDVADVISGSYNLEVSSPGIDRPLTRVAEFAMWSGNQIKLSFKQSINGKKTVKATLVEAKADRVIIATPSVFTDYYGDNDVMEIPFANIGEAKLVLTDELLKSYERIKAKER